ncbi:junctional adhesion molecule-like [Trichomycterus rosablanca]|uniref:junctional adhesion molecule-like n=1 Tax=Trichomycterus rosablanca TaxID=2290929 RepID=UPI002F35DF4B
MNFQMFLLYICILLFICCDFSSEDPLINVNAPVGSTALLPCNCTTEPDKTPRVLWKTDSETVFERQGDVSYHGEGYKGRVDVSEDELNKGNFSLVLKNVSVNDENVYTCSLVVKPKQDLIQKVRLSVVDKPEPTPTPPPPPPPPSPSPPPSPPYWIIIVVLCVGLVAVAVIFIIYRKKREYFHHKSDVKAPEPAQLPLNSSALDSPSNTNNG